MMPREPKSTSSTSFVVSEEPSTVGIVAGLEPFCRSVTNCCRRVSKASSES